MESLLNYFLSTIRRERREALELRENYDMLRAQYQDLEDRYSILQSKMEEQTLINDSIMKRLEFLERKYHKVIILLACSVVVIVVIIIIIII